MSLSKFIPSQCSWQLVSRQHSFVQIRSCVAPLIFINTSFPSQFLAFLRLCMASQKRVHTTAASRLRQDYLRILKDPVPYITALPLSSNILEWYVTFHHFYHLSIQLFISYVLISLISWAFGLF